MAETEEELKRLLMKVKVESENSWLKAQLSENKDLGIWSHHFMASRWENSENSDSLFIYFFRGGPPKLLQMVTATIKLKDACSLEEKP